MRNVLIIDSDESQRDLILETLSGEGFNVTLSSTRAEALKHLNSQKVDVILMSLFLDDGPSYQLFTENSLEKVAVIGIGEIFQGPTTRQLLEQRYPFLAVLGKPLDGARMVDLLRVHFGNSYPPPPKISQGLEDDLILGEHFFHPRSIKTRALQELDPIHESPPTLGAPSRPKTDRFPPLDPPPLEETNDLVIGGLNLNLSDEASGMLPLGLDWRRIPTRGDLSMVSFAALLASILRSGLSGVLRVWQERVRKIITFKNGCPTSMRSNLLYECLGRLLVREGWVEEEICEAAVKTAQNTQQRLGEVLLSQEMITPRQLDLTLQRQIQIRILDIFSWERAEYQLQVEETQMDVAFDQEQMAQLIIKGSLEFTTPERAMRDLQEHLHHQVTAVVSLEAFDSLQLPLPQQEIVEIFQGGGLRTLLELVARFEESAQSYQTIHALAALGMISFETGDQNSF